MLIGQSRTDDGNPLIFLLQAGQPPIEVARPGRRPLGAFEDAIRIGQRWIFAAAQGSGQLSATVVWTIEEGVMHELVRVPRSALGPRVPVRLARRSDGNSIGLVVEGQVDAASRVSMLWVVPVAMDSGVTDDPEELVPSRLGGLSVDVCSVEDSGWVVEMPYPGAVTVGLDQHALRLFSPLSRLRVARSRACVEGLLGSLENGPDAWTSDSTADRRSAGIEGHAAHRTMEVGAPSGGVSRTFRCWQSSP
jgi:hypothetical protein